MRISGSIHVAANGIILFLFNGWVVFRCAYVPHLLNPFIYWWTFRVFSPHILAIVKSVAMNKEVHVSFWMQASSGYLRRIGIAGSYGSSIFSFLRNLQTLLHSGCTVYIPTNNVGGLPFLHTLCRERLYGPAMFACLQTARTFLANYPEYREWCFRK